MPSTALMTLPMSVCGVGSFVVTPHLSSLGFRGLGRQTGSGGGGFWVVLEQSGGHVAETIPTGKTINMTKKQVTCIKIGVIIL
ncbi:MAG: hypothetical protein FJ241_05505 [Nitrospira sp.]|nr:hypothetical protein [Nitrospira sp.]